MRNICSRGFLRKCKIATTIRALQFHNSDFRYIIGKWKNTKRKKIFQIYENKYIITWKFHKLCWSGEWWRQRECLTIKQRLLLKIARESLWPTSTLTPSLITSVTHLQHSFMIFGTVSSDRLIATAGLLCTHLTVH